MSGVVQANHRFPALPDDQGFVEHMKEQVRDRFARELVNHLTERGGIVGPIHEKVSEQDDWLWKSGTKTVDVAVYAYVTDLPEPEEYRLMGGPADGAIVRTGGARTWRVPFLPRMSASAPFDLNERIDLNYAEYEREGDTQVYLYRRVAR